MKFLALSLACLTGLALSGCGGGPAGPQTYKVSGSVSFDGAPVQTGDIIFRRTADQMAFGGQIKDGRYELESEAGDMKVEIVARREVPGKFTTINVVKEPVTEMYIPRKYNTATELATRVEANHSAPVNFELTSK